MSGDIGKMLDQVRRALGIAQIEAGLAEALEGADQLEVVFRNARGRRRSDSITLNQGSPEFEAIRGMLLAGRKKALEEAVETLRLAQQGEDVSDRVKRDPDDDIPF